MQRRSLQGDWHGVSDEVLAPAVAEFLRKPPTSGPGA